MFRLRASPIRRADGALDESSVAALARAASESHEVVERELRAENATLKAQALHYQTAIDNILQGVCFFDQEGRLVSSADQHLTIQSARRLTGCEGRAATASPQRLRWSKD